MACYHPVTIELRKKEWARSVSLPTAVPCGSCLGCRGDQARNWAIRAQHEARMHDSAWFLTLTYDEENIPKFGALCPEHLSVFFKTLRRREAETAHRHGREPKRLSYYACGEYGERSERPHYHALLFGFDFLDKHIHRNDRSGTVWRAGSLEDSWRFGNSEFSAVTPKSASYVTGYVRKKVSRKVYPNEDLRVDPETGELIAVQGEFARMSLRPAIGARWIKWNWRDVYPRDFVVVGGQEFRPPRYYDKWMAQDHGGEFPCGDCRTHQEVMYRVKEKRYAEALDLTPEKLKAKEKIHRARMSLFERRTAV